MPAGGIQHIMNMSKGALSTNQTALATTSHNISNANTEGYSRQRVELETENPLSIGKSQIGGGVRIGTVARTHSSFLNQRLQGENSSLGKFEGAADIYSQVETIFKNDGEEGIAKSVSDFFNNIRSLSAQPESAPLRSAVRESAQNITARFQGVAGSVDAVVQDLNRRVEGSVVEINALTSRIASLNQRIVETEMAGGGMNANDERDARDLTVQKLAKIIPVDITPVDNGSINVASGKVGILVNGSDRVEFGTQRTSDGPNPGANRVTVLGGAGSNSVKDVTDFIDSGSLGAYIQVRDREVPQLMGRIDTIAYNLSEQVNGIHRDAFSRNGTKGTDFFQNLGTAVGAASRFTLSDAVKSDVSNIATAQASNAPGDNRALLAIADLQDKKIFDNGKANFTDYTSSTIGALGIESKANIANLETQQGVMEQLKSMREQVAGVSIDEEAINMLKFQKAFDANAKMIQTADSMLETVLNLKRF